MISTFQEVHTALRSNANQHVIIYFDDSDTLFTDGDVVLETGITLNSSFCSEENLTYGLTPSATIDFDLFNDDGVLNDFLFGKFKFYLGVALRTDSLTEATIPNVTCLRNDSYSTMKTSFSQYTTSFTKYQGYSVMPYLRINGTAAQVQPPFPVYSIVCQGDGYLRCYGRDGEVFICTIDGQTNVTQVVTETWEQQRSKTWQTEKARTWGDLMGVTMLTGFVQKQAIRFSTERLGIWYYPNSGIATICSDGTEYEVCKFDQLGVFWANRPVRVRTSAISLTGYDAMTALMDRFVEQNDNILEDLTFENQSGVTWTQIYEEIANYADVEITSTSRTLIQAMNRTMGTRVIFPGKTLREILGFVAGACAANARFTNDGKLDLTRIGTYISPVLTEENYTEFAPCTYMVRAIEKVQVTFSGNDYGAVYGTGTNTYVFTENPLLEYTNNTAGNTLARNLYNAIYKGTYYPASLEWFGDYTVEAGNVLRVQQGDETFELPIFTQTIFWNGMVLMTCESTGDEYHEQTDFYNREEYQTNRKFVQVEKTVDQFMQQYSEEQVALDGTLTSYNTRITQNSQAISTEADRASDAEGNLSTRITQNATAISSEASRAQVQEDILRTRISQTASDITSEATRATNSEGVLSTRITQNADAITAEATRAGGVESGLSSRITQTQSDITSEVTRAQGAESSLGSRITQTEDSITSEVTRAQNAESGLGSRITQTEDSITAEVTRAQNAESGLGSRITQTQSSITSEVTRAQNAETSLGTRITQLSDNIDLTVVKNDNVLAKINASTEGVLIQANKIKIGNFEYGDANTSIKSSYYTGKNTNNFTGFGANADWAFWAGNGKFRVTQAGKVYATDGEFSGDFSSGGWSFADDGMHYAEKNTAFLSIYATASEMVLWCVHDITISANYGAQLSKITLDAEETCIGEIWHANSPYYWHISSGGYIYFQQPNPGSYGGYGNLGLPAWPIESVNAIQYNNSSSRKIKKDIHDLVTVEAVIKRLNPVSFKYKNTEKTRFGLIYEDTLDILPEICTVPETKDGIGSVNYIDLIAILLKGEQELYARLEKLEGGSFCD